MVTLSSSATAVLAAVLVAYVVALFLLSIYATRKIENEEDYLVAGRRLPLFLTWGTLLATWFGAATMLGAAQAARDEGVRGTILDPFACAATLVLAGLFFAGPLWRMKLLTMGDFYRRTYGTRAEILSCTIQVPSYFGWIAAQYIALGSIQEVYFGIPLTYGILISTALPPASSAISSGNGSRAARQVRNRRTLQRSARLVQVAGRTSRCTPTTTGSSLHSASGLCSSMASETSSGPASTHSSARSPASPARRAGSPS